MSWTSPRTWVTNEVPTATNFNTHLRDNMNETAPALATTAGSFFVVDAANDLVEQRFDTDSTTTAETTTSTTYTDLTTADTVTFYAAQRCLIIINARCYNPTGTCYVSFTLSGGTTVAAADNRALAITSPDVQRSSVVVPVVGLTKDSGIVCTLQYRVTAGTGTFGNRTLIVLPF